MGKEEYRRMQTLAERVDWLFRQIRPSSESEYTYQEVEAGTKQLGYPVTGAYVWKMRKGKAEKPNWLILRSLARFFKVPITFFYDETLTEEKLARILRAARGEVSVAQPALRRIEIERESEIEKKAEISLDPEISEIASQASKLDKDGRQTVLQIIRLVMGRGKSEER